MLYRVAKRLTLDPHEAEDLVGQTLMQAAKGWSSFDGRHARSWLLRILKNIHFSGSTKPKPVPVPEHLPSNTNTFELVAYRIATDTVLNALDSLPLDYRVVVALSDLEQMTPEEIASILEIPSATVRTRLHRGRKILRAKLPGFESEKSHSETITHVAIKPCR